MKRFAFLGGLLASAALLSGCAVYNRESDDAPVLMPVFDAQTAVSFLYSSSGVEPLPVNLTAEQADELFGSIEVYGANLALPMRVSDLPEGFTLDYDSDNISSSQDRSRYRLSADICVADGEELVSVAQVDILLDGNREEDVENGCIVSFDLHNSIISGAHGAVKIDGTGIGDLYSEEFVQAYGSGYCYEAQANYVCRIYYDGERKLQFIYRALLDENGEVDVEKTIRENGVFIFNLTAVPYYETIYRFDEVSAGEEAYRGFM